MNQLTFADADFAGQGKTTRKKRFLSEMEQVVPWPAPLRLITRVYAEVQLRREGGNAFKDAILEQTVGKHISARGVEIAGSTILLSDWKVLPEA